MKKSGLIVILLLLFFTTVRADILTEQYETSGVAELEEFTQPAKNFDPDFSYDETARKLLSGQTEKPDSLVVKIINFLFSGIKENIVLCMNILLISLCLSGFSAFIPETEKIFDTAFYVCYAVIFVLGIKTLENGVRIASESIDSMSFFMKAAVPVMGGMLAASGGVSGCVAVVGSIMTVTGVFGVFAQILLPLCRVSAILCGVNNLNCDFSLKGLSGLLQKSALWCLGIVMVVFTGILAVGGFTAANLDGVAGRTVKYITGNAVPIVGGVVADTLGHIIACGKAVKGAAGGAALIAMLYICIAPVLEIAAMIITYRLALIVISPIADRRICGVIEDFIPVLKIAMSLVICSGIMFVVCIGVMMAM